MTDTNIGNEDTGTSTDNDQAAGKTYTQQEVNDMIAKAKGNIAKKFERQYADLGDPEELRALKSDAEKRRTEEQMKRGEFEKTLQEIVSRKDEEIKKRDNIIQDFRLNTPLLETAAKFRAVKPEQVRDLLKSNVKLDENGEPVVVDNQGKIRYADSGTPLSVTDLVQTFLQENPHFVQPTPSTTNTKSSHTADGTGKVNLANLDMSNPAHRKIFAEAKAKGQFQTT